MKKPRLQEVKKLNSDWLIWNSIIGLMDTEKTPSAMKVSFL